MKHFKTLHDMNLSSVIVCSVFEAYDDVICNKVDQKIQFEFFLHVCFSLFFLCIDKGNEKEKHLKMNSFSEFSPSHFLYINMILSTRTCLIMSIHG